MKVFISDIHLTDTTTGAHNITIEDVEFFWNDIQVEGIKKEDIELVILGDFLDCIRSTKWKDKTQPWSNNSNSGKTAKKIAEEIIIKNKEVVEKLKEKFKGRITYIMGNHDRLVWQVPEVKSIVQNALGLSNEKIALEYNDSGIFAAHGNQWDVYNAFDFEKKDDAPIGDAIVTLLINKFPEEVEKKLKDASLKKALQEIDNLRPTFLAPLWIEHSIDRLPETKKKIVKEIWKGLVEDFYKDDFVEGWFDKYDVWYNPVDKADKLQLAFEHFTETSMQKLLDRLIQVKEGFYKPKEEFIVGAGKDMDKNNCRFTLYGHTHEKALHLLDKEADNGKFYLNTGTWRRRVILGETRKRKQIFSPIKTISYAVFYNDKEKKNTKRDFELWDGAIV